MSANGAGGRASKGGSPSLSSLRDGVEIRMQRLSDRANMGPGPGQADLEGSASTGGTVEPGRQAAALDKHDKHDRPDGHRERVNLPMGNDVDGSDRNVALDDHPHYVHPPGTSRRGQEQGMGMEPAIGNSVDPPSVMTSASASMPIPQSGGPGVVTELGPNSPEGLRLGNSNGGADALSAVVRDGGGLATLAVAATISGRTFTPPAGVVEAASRDTSPRSAELLDVAGGGGRYRMDVDMAADSRSPGSLSRVAPPHGSRRPQGYLPIPSSSMPMSASSGTAHIIKLEDGLGNSTMTRGPGPGSGPGPGLGSGTVSGLSQGMEQGGGPPCGRSAMAHEDVGGRLASTSETDLRDFMGKLGGATDSIGISAATEARARCGGGGSGEEAGRRSPVADGPVMPTAPQPGKGLGREELQAEVGVSGPEREGKRMRFD